ncbi:MAG: DUF5615 family PIN-like protein [Anaerolineae bacterium]|nr:DUF5615 family PIN-like protein [Anaerolineae bacterium]MDQ7034690.1 DUF5615 family PIN-like protein [Anaerolineae bacterium]
MVIKFLIDEQINVRVAPELRAKGLEAVSVHELGLGNQSYKDAPLLELATSRGETILTLDKDFPRLHAEWMEIGKNHCGIFYGETSKYQRTGAIGILVNFCVEWAQLIGDDDEILKQFVYNQIEYIREL